MWSLVVGVALAIGSVTEAPASREILLRPNSEAQYRWMTSQAPVKVWSSRVRKGKSWGACMEAVYRCLAVPGYPVALTRFEFASMRESTLQTLQRMLGPDLWTEYWKESHHTLYFPPVMCDDGVKRQSRIVCFGWVDPGRALSTEYGLIVMEQAEQMEREHVAFAQTRLNYFDPWQEARCELHGIRPRQLGIICNADDPEHWINQDYVVQERGERVEIDAKTGRDLYEVILSRPEDNAENLTADYSDRLEMLRGTVWYDRLVGGQWVRAEGLVYGQAFDPAVHIVDRPADWSKWGGYPPPMWPRHRAMDFGIRHPFTCAWYAESPNRELFCYREVYGTGQSPSEWAAVICAQEAKEVDAWRAGCSDEAEARALAPYLAAYTCQYSVSDHELGWRSELDRCGVWTTPAQKDIRGMVATMTSVLRERKLFYVRGLLVAEDPVLVQQKLPTSVLGEYGRYKWPKRKDSASETSDQRLDAPVDRDNHGLDRDGYMVVAWRGSAAVGIGG